MLDTIKKLFANEQFQFVSCISSLLMWLGSFIIAAAKKGTLCIWLMFGAHTTQNAIIGIKTGKRAGLDTLTSIAKCYCYGFAWWLPLLWKLNDEGK